MDSVPYEISRIPPSLREERLDPLFWRPARTGVESAWYGHIPFAFWLVVEARPRVIVELGTHNGVSYSAFCEAVQRIGLPCRCFAVDTWKGDRHAGFYGEDVYEEFSRFHERYRAFSSLLRMEFDTAAEMFEDGSIDLLHIDGEHSYEAVRHDFITWQSKLSDGAIVLFHDTNARGGGFGVWRLWSELSRQWPGFEFLHCSGLGVLAVGSRAPEPVLDLSSADAWLATRVRERFSLLGERCEFQTRLGLSELAARDAAAAYERAKAAYDSTQHAYDNLQRESRRLLGNAAEEARVLSARGDDLERQKVGSEKQVRTLTARCCELERQAVSSEKQVQALTARCSELEGRAVSAEGRAQVFQQERDLILGSTTWRMTGPLRGIVHVARQIRRGRDNVASAEVTVRSTERSAVNVDRIRVLFVSGEPGTPGHHYRIEDYAAAAKRSGAAVAVLRIEDLDPAAEIIRQSDVLFIWRATWSDRLAAAIANARGAGAKIVFDLDDLMFRPELTESDLIDGIRMQNFEPAGVARCYELMRQTLTTADAFSCTTVELSREAHQLIGTSFVLPNGFREEFHRQARLAVRRKRCDKSEGIVRLGYAGGTLTHQRDFAVAAAGLATVLADHPECRLVLFRDPVTGRRLIEVDELPVLAPFEGRIEWRDLVPLKDLPGEIARFDINLAPLEAGNPYCESKSELKYFEAAVCSIPTVASPTGPMKRAIQEGVTGRLAADSSEWVRALRDLLDQPEQRSRMGTAAYRDVLWRHGPERRTQLIDDCLRTLLHRKRFCPSDTSLVCVQSVPPRFDIPESEVLFEKDRLCEAEVTVVVPLFNYANYVEEALDSIRNQDLSPLDLIVVEDCSADDSLSLALGWVERWADRFNRVLVLRNRVNSGLARTRNAGFDSAESPFILPLDADNRLRPRCCSVLLQALTGSRGTAFAYPILQCFGDRDNLIGDSTFDPVRLASGNYIDALALIGKWAWAAVGGYTHQWGWDDYDLWCSFVEHGFGGLQVSEILADYRVHERSMLRTDTDISHRRREIVRSLERRHPWLRIPELLD